MDETEASFEQLAGGYAAYCASHDEIVVVARYGQERLRRALDQLGPPGDVRYDPFLGELELRGRVFQAEAIGSFDGSGWLWSWANPTLGLPDARMTTGRRMREAATSLGIPAFGVGLLDDDNESLPQRMGDLAVGHGFGDAYYVVNRSVVYLLAPGQLAEPDDRLDTLRDAWASVATEPTLRATVVAAVRLGLTVAPKPPFGVVITDPADDRASPLTVTTRGQVLEPVAIVFQDHETLVDDFVQPLLTDDRLRVLAWFALDDHSFDLSGDGYSARFTRIEGHDALRRAVVTRLGAPEERLVAAYTLEVCFVGDYSGTRYIVHDPAPTAGAESSGFARGWAPTSIRELTGGRAQSRAIPGEALILCERLAAEGALVFDLSLGRRYEPAAART